MAPRHALPERNDRAIGALGVVSPPPILVQTDTFEGSLGTLFQCVRDHKVDLLDVPLFPICEAYFAYLLANAATDLDEAAAALGALAYLLERKAWMLLPTPEPEPEEVEAFAVLEPTIAGFGVAIEALRQWQEDRDRLFFRSPEAGPDPYELPFVLDDVRPQDLALALDRLLRRAQPDPLATMATPRRSLSDQMRLVLLAVTAEWRTLAELVPDPITRTEAVYWFLAILELVRLGQVGIRLDAGDVQFARP